MCKFTKNLCVSLLSEPLYSQYIKLQMSKRVFFILIVLFLHTQQRRWDKISPDKIIPNIIAAQTFFFFCRY